MSEYPCFKGSPNWSPESLAIQSVHPWRSKYSHSNDSEDVPIVSEPDYAAPPIRYREHTTMKLRMDKGRRTRDLISLSDVEQFRRGSAQYAKGITPDGKQKGIIYRRTHVYKEDCVLLEAAYGETFLPDRLDLRFLFCHTSRALSLAEGDYVSVDAFDLVPLHYRDSIQLDPKGQREPYPIVWCAVRFERVEWSSSPLRKWKDETFGQEQMGYVTGVTKEGNPRVELLAPVEGEDSVDVEKVLGELVPHTLALFRQGPIIPARVFTLIRPDATRPELEKTLRKEFASAPGLYTTSQRNNHVIYSLSPCPLPDRWVDRLGAFNSYGESGDWEMMRDMFILGHRAREVLSKRDKEEDEEYGDVPPIVRDTLAQADPPRALLDALYGKKTVSYECDDPEQVTFGQFTLNREQSIAANAYLDHDGPKIMGVLSPPGSGKTLCAAVMAAREARRGGGTQLLLGVQNSAVENLASTLKKVDPNASAFFIRSQRLLDPRGPIAFDVFDRMPEQERLDWITSTPLVRWIEDSYKEKQDDETPVKPEEDKSKGKESEKKEENDEDEIWEEKRRDPTFCYCLSAQSNNEEIQVNYHRTEILLATTDMALFKVSTPSSIQQRLQKVEKVIIDEASILTESAFVALLSAFPKARFVLVGDEKQLPPFMFDSEVLCHQLAGRSALEVAMRSANSPIVELSRVYRACQRLISPINRLSYSQRLVSMKTEDPSILLPYVKQGMAQLVYVQFDGPHTRDDDSKSLYNESELTALTHYLGQMSIQQKQKTVIICLYKEARRRVKKLHPTMNSMTVDSSQGKESEIVILLTTRSNEASPNSFFRCPKRCTVAMSRQKEALIVFGNPEACSWTSPWATVLEGGEFSKVEA